jgi:hypothetical protein
MKSDRKRSKARSVFLMVYYAVCFIGYVSLSLFFLAGPYGPLPGTVNLIFLTLAAIHGYLLVKESYRYGDIVDAERLH